ncbi:MAG: DUF4112 domain-containing protein [Geminicoccaceae bacterium]|nr:DUF4112 domain-containing protein [Geminicoccaceae bacterium]
MKRGEVAGHATRLSPGVERRLAWLAHLLDDRFRLPGTNMRFGLDGVLGLVPGVGDTATTLVALYIVGEAWRHGISKRVLVQMLANTGVDWLVGAIPLVGDIFDFAFKGNRRNIALLHRELGIAKADPLSDRVPDRLSPAMRSTGEGRSGRRG